MRYDGPAEPFKIAGKLGRPDTIFDSASLTFQHGCGGNSCPEKVPAPVLARYAAAKKGEQFQYSADEASAIAHALYAGDSNKHAKAEWSEK